MFIDNNIIKFSIFLRFINLDVMEVLEELKFVYILIKKVLFGEI